MLLGIFFVLLPSVFARQIVIGPRDTLTFYENVTEGNIFKFIYRTREPIKLTLSDPKGRVVRETTASRETIYTKAMIGGRYKIHAENPTNSPMELSYKCPDPAKELSGNLGYVKDTDLVNDLARLLDDLVVGQEKHLKRIVEHKKMVESSHGWVKLLIFFEVVMTIGTVYFLHRNFIQMFEQRKSL